MKLNRVLALPVLAGVLMGGAMLATPGTASADEAIKQNSVNIKCYDGACWEEGQNGKPTERTFDWNYHWMREENPGWYDESSGINIGNQINYIWFDFDPRGFNNQINVAVVNQNATANAISLGGDATAVAANSADIDQTNAASIDNVDVDINKKKGYGSKKSYGRSYGKGGGWNSWSWD